VLFAFDALDTSRVLYASEQNPSRDRAGPALRFNIPMVANGHVYVGAKREVDVYGLLSQGTARKLTGGFFSEHSTSPDPGDRNHHGIVRVLFIEVVDCPEFSTQQLCTAFAREMSPYWKSLSAFSRVL
jgi:hypothetical protein